MTEGFLSALSSTNVGRVANKEAISANTSEIPQIFGDVNRCSSYEIYSEFDGEIW